MRLNPYKTMTPGEGNWMVDGAVEIEKTCWYCDGTGKTEDSDGNEIDCPDCRGEGYTIERR